MEKFLTQLLLTFGLILGILAKPHAFDDEGEISVPRSPKIEGPPVVTLQLKNLRDEENLECHIEGSPTPSVIWLKDGQEVRQDDDSYTTRFDVTEGRATLSFKDSAYEDTKYRTGNFTCMAANFLGQVQKLFIVTVEEKDASNTTTAISHPVPVDGNNTSPDEDGTSTNVLANSTSTEQTSTSNKEDLVTHTDKEDAISTTAKADLVLTSSISRNSLDVTSTHVTASKR